MNNNLKNLIMTLIVTSMCLSMAACGNAASSEELIPDISVVNAEGLDEDVPEEESAEEEKAESEASEEEAAEENAVEEEPVAEEIVYDLKNVSTWNTNGTVNLGYSYTGSDVAYCLAMWSDYDETETGGLKFTRLENGFYFEAPVDIYHVQNSAGRGKEGNGFMYNYLGIREGDGRFMVWYSTVPGVFGTDNWFEPFEGYESIHNDEFEIWYLSEEISAEEVQTILDSCVACRTPEELEAKYYELENRYMPQE